MKQLSRLLPLALIVCLMGEAHLFAKNKAILVGINHYPDPKLELVAAQNDVALVRSFLVDHLGFDQSDIIVIENEEATATALTDAIKNHLIRSATKDDAVFLYFAGHGTGVKDFDGDEKDGLDETLVTYDFDPTDPDTWFTDDLLYELLRRVPTRKVITVFDCCHSGSGNRSIQTAPTAASEYRSRFAASGFFSFDVDVPDPEFLRSRSVLSTQPDPYHIFLAACQDEEESWEGVYQGKVHGVFTNVLFGQLDKKASSSLGDITGEVKSEIVKFSTSNPGLKLQTPSSTLSEETIVLSLREYLASTPNLPSFGGLPQDIKAEGVPRQSPPTLDDVVPGYRPQGDVGVVLTTKKVGSGGATTQFATGDLLEIELLSDTNGFAELYYYGVDDNIYRIFPNGQHSDNAIQAGKKLVIPGGDMKFRLRMALPENFEPEIANEVLVALVTTEPFSEEKSEETKQRLFKIVDGKKLNPAAERLIEIEETGNPRFGEAMVIYRIGK